MLTAHDFWSRVDAERPAAVTLIVLDSWKVVADTQGIPSTDMAYVLFEAMSLTTTKRCTFVGRLGIAALGLAWRHIDDARAVDALGRWQPAILTAGEHEMLDLRLWWMTAALDAGEEITPFRLRLKDAAETHMSTLPENEQYSALVDLSSMTPAEAFAIIQTRPQQPLTLPQELVHRPAPMHGVAAGRRPRLHELVDPRREGLIARRLDLHAPEFAEPRRRFARMAHVAVAALTAATHSGDGHRDTAVSTAGTDGTGAAVPGTSHSLSH